MLGLVIEKLIKHELHSMYPHKYGDYELFKSLHEYGVSLFHQFCVGKEEIMLRIERFIFFGYVDLAEFF